MADDKKTVLTQEEEDVLEKLKYVFRTFSGVTEQKVAAHLTAVWAASTSTVDLSAFGIGS